MWYGSMFQPCSDEEITADIQAELTKLLSAGMPPGADRSATTTATAAVAVQNIENVGSVLSLLRMGVTAGQTPAAPSVTSGDSGMPTSTAGASITALESTSGSGSSSVSGSSSGTTVEFDFAW